MPAGVWAVPFAVGGRAHSRESERVERVSEIQDPARGRMAGQERRIDDTMLIREAQGLQEHRQFSLRMFLLHLDLPDRN